MKLPDKKIFQDWWLTGLLIVLLCWLIASQTLLLSSFDKAKTRVSAWPFLSQPHVQFAQALFADGQQAGWQELEYAKKTLFKNQEKINQTEKILNRETIAYKNIDFWQNLIDQGLTSPLAFRQLCFYNLQVRQNKQALDNCQQALNLDPNNRELKENLESVQKIISLK